MSTAILLIELALVVLAGTAVADRVKVPAPLLLIVVGVAASYLPFLPAIHLEPELVLVGLLPPLLYAAAIQTSLVDFNANRGPILVLSVALVIATTFGTGAVVHWVVPQIGWAAALAIGAVVAPPDAVAATAIGRRIGLPRRIVTILEGESLLNDATALVALRTAIAALAGGVTLAQIGLDFVRAAGGGALVGLLVFVVVARLRRLITDPLLDTAISFVTPYVGYVLAETVHASGVIAVVVSGLLLGHKAPIVQTAQSRITERITWRTVAFVLENAVFLLIGLQARWIVQDVAHSELGAGRIVAVCLGALVAVIVIRIVWLFASRPLLLLRGDRENTPWQGTALIGWAGMRGVVTLAAAFVIPADTPHRNVLLLIAFTVVAGTLFLQGLTLPWLTRRLGVTPPDPAEEALARATVMQQAAKAGFDRLDGLDYDDRHGVGDLIRTRVEQRTFAAWERLGTVPGEEAPSDLYARIRREMIEAERARVLQVRRQGRVPSEVISEVLGMLDLEESMLDVATEARETIRAATGPQFGDACADLLHADPAVVYQPGDDGPASCSGCERDGTVPVALRRCLTCGTVGCCDSSVGRHATEHFQDTSHPVMQSIEAGESWRWCYLHHRTG